METSTVRSVSTISGRWPISCFASASDAVIALDGHEGVCEADLSVRVAHDLVLTIRADDLPDTVTDGVMAAIDQRAQSLDGHTTVVVDGAVTEITWTARRTTSTVVVDGAVTEITWTVPLDHP